MAKTFWRIITFIKYDNIAEGKMIKKSYCMSHAGIRHMLARKKDVEGQSGRELILQQRSIYINTLNTECHESRTVKNNRMVTEAAAY